MQVVSFSEARESFKAVLDRVEADADVTLITRRHAQGAVVMSLDTYNSLMETVHLLRSPANAAHLLARQDRRQLKRIDRQAGTAAGDPLGLLVAPDRRRASALLPAGGNHTCDPGLPLPLPLSAATNVYSGLRKSPKAFH